MEIFHLHHHSFYFILFTLSLPLFCFLSWVSSTAPPPPPPSALAASQALKSHGYFLFSDLITTAVFADTTNSWNGTGTIFAPPDFAFSFATAKFNDYRRYPPPRPSAALLLYYTLHQPLTWKTLTARAEGDELRTWHPNRCLLVSKTYNGDLAITGSKKSIAAFKIRQPDLYVDDRLVVHGVDGVLDPTAVSKCSFPDPTAQIKSQIDRSFLDHAVKVLRRKGFSVVATAMSTKWFDLISLKAVTVFAPSDATLFSDSNGFRYDFLHHVVPKRYRFNDIANLSARTVMETVSPKKTVVIGSSNGDVTVNGVEIYGSEVYNNQWIVVLSVSRSIDSEPNNQISGGFSISRIAGDPASAPRFTGLENTPSPLPSRATDSKVNSQLSGEFSKTGVQYPAPTYSSEIQSPAITGYYGRSPYPANEEGGSGPLGNWRCSPQISPAISDGVSITVECEDLFCPESVRRVQDSGTGASAYVEQSSPSTEYGQLPLKLAQSGPSHELNKNSEPVVECEPSDEVSSAETGRRELSSSQTSSGSEGNSGNSGVPSTITDQVSLADDLFFYT